MGEYLCAIEANKECSTDEAFAFQVRLQLLAQRANQVREQREVAPANAGTGPVPTHSSILYLRTLQTQLQQLRKSLPTNLQQQGQ